MKPLHRGASGPEVHKLLAATNHRLKARNLSALAANEDGPLGPHALIAVRKALWALGAQPATYNAVTQDGVVSIGAQRMIRSPGHRTQQQLDRGHARMSNMRADRARRAKALAAEKAKASKRAKVVDLAQMAAANYRKNPVAYHYLAGGIANTIFLKPTPITWRSDCSQFVASVYKAAGLPSPANVPHEFASTFSIVKCPQARITVTPRPGDLGMYGDRSGALESRNTHHVELYAGEPGQEFIGHGSPPVDSLTPGRPDFYVTFTWLD